MAQDLDFSIELRNGESITLATNEQKELWVIMLRDSDTLALLAATMTADELRRLADFIYRALGDQSTTPKEND